MTSERYTTRAAVMLFLLRQQAGQQQTLLQRRQNTGYADGLWDCAASGHLEAGESVSAGLCREAAEELGISLQPADLHFTTLVHKYVPELELPYFNIYFWADIFSGQPRINEPQKCSELAWFDLNDLPADLIADRRLILQQYALRQPYLELGW